ncbi:MAG: sigma 54-interacting transcriptional regulator [Pontiellaceae bacterium]|nr:sigma 54-interacting transcriptional regulator [Pontiellaceae bacterium]MBN2784166.1 sigma 54-interacting transcriptional regulator [Pontiellaceae bacterium]
MLFDVWREVSRHIDIKASSEHIAKAMAPHIPLGNLAIFRLRPDENMLESVSSSAPHIPLNSIERQELEDWSRTRGSVHFSAHGIPPKPLAAPLSRLQLPSDTDVLAGPLVRDDQWIGLLVIQSPAGEPFSDLHRQLVEALLDPLSAALENDRRLQELKILRDVADAEKIAALRRLGREQLNSDIVGIDGGLRSVIARIDMVAHTSIPILILGETGTGKEAIARLVHEHSTRSGGPFMRVNSGAIPTELLDTELFGHEKGSFTGAVSSRRGWFERANGGTLLLDEIGELPPAAQVRLLRVLQEGTFERVGGEQSVQVNVRVIAATHRDLPAMVQQGTFREDLWYRISGFPIVLPPLRERIEDIPALAQHFARRAAHHFGLMPQMPTKADLKMLSEYPWPGNIREFASVIDRAAILGDGQKLDISKALGGPEPSEPRRSVKTAATTIPPLSEVMRSHIITALKATKGRIEGAGGTADLLQINPHTLRARMRKLGIDWSEFRKSSES